MGVEYGHRQEEDFEEEGEQEEIAADESSSSDKEGNDEKDPKEKGKEKTCDVIANAMGVTVGRSIVYI